MSHYAAGRAAWPTLAVTEAAYDAYVAARAADPEARARLHGADLYLACACASGDAAAIALFDAQLLVPLPARLGKGGVPRALAEEVVQELRAKLFVAGPDGRARIGDYDGRGPLAAWVRVAAVRAASNQRRDAANRDALLAADGGAASAPASLPVIDPALALIRRQYGDEFQAAIRDAFATLSDDDRTLLRLHFSDGLDLAAAGRVLGVSRATAGRRMLAARERVRDETLRLLGERIVATPAELESLLGAVRSTLEVSLGVLVA